jgi:hypothetical protein
VHYASDGVFGHAREMLVENSAEREFLDMIGAANAENPPVIDCFSVH